MPTPKNKTLALMLVALLGAGLGFVLSPEALASNGGFLPLPDDSNLDLPSPQGQTASERFGNLLGPIARNLRVIIGAVAVLMIIASGFIIVLQGDNEETVRNEKQAITYGIIGLMMISIAGPISEVFDFRQGNILESPEELVQRAALFDNATGLIITFVKYLLGGLATLMFVSSGATMISSQGNEDAIGRGKRNLALGAGGLFLIFISDLVVRRVLYDARYNTSSSEVVISINESELVTQIVAFTNLIVTFVGPIMMLGIIIGGVLYVVAGGDEGRTDLAKKIIKNSVIGIVIIYGAFALVSTVITGAF